MKPSRERCASVAVADLALALGKVQRHAVPGQLRKIVQGLAGEGQIPVDETHQPVVRPDRVPTGEVSMTHDQSGTPAGIAVAPHGLR